MNICVTANRVKDASVKTRTSPYKVGSASCSVRFLVHYLRVQRSLSRCGRREGTPDRKNYLHSHENTCNPFRNRAVSSGGWVHSADAGARKDRRLYERYQQPFQWRHTLNYFWVKWPDIPSYGRG